MLFRRLAIPFGLLLVFGQRLPADDGLQFNRDIRPILSAKCFQCHGPDQASREADLRLDISDATSGPFLDRSGSVAIEPGSLENSVVWQRINSTDPSEVMPPPEANKEPLSSIEKEWLKKWILAGADYDTFWAFAPPQKQSLPEVDERGWSGDRIDRFVLSRLERENRPHQLEADRRTLIRRLTFDLTGLPPTRAAIAAYVQDESPNAYERVVDRLLASSAYGEHMAKYWLDLVRFADTNGIHHDHYREMTPYRDWVIRSFNENLPFRNFVIDQIAGDLHDAPSRDQLIASGFNRLHLVIDRGTAIPEESFARNVIDRVNAVGTAFLGLTVGCAVCHDHKYDPITQKDFYQLYAFFNNIDATPETPGRNVHAPFIRLGTPEQEQQLSELELQVADAKKKVQSLQKQIKAMDARLDAAAKQTGSENEGSNGSDTSKESGKNDGSVDATASSDPSSATANSVEILSQQRDELDSRLKAAEAQFNLLETQRSKLDSEIPISLVMKERDEVRPTHVLIRGVYDQPGEEVQRNTPSFLPPLESSGPIKTRMDLALWLTDSQHPLTARVTVNRLWQQLFGLGLVRTSEDFGMQGEWPSHPELLDELTLQFIQTGWDVKRLLRTMVLSATYRQSSTSSPQQYRADPANRLLARGSRFRMDAEMIRDEILAVSGMLSRNMFGKSVKPPQPPNLWKNVSMVSSSTYEFKADEGENIHRRSLYSFWKRALPPPQMTIFDAPTRESCIARRERTNTPLQALVLMNESQLFKASTHFARRLLLEHAGSGLEMDTQRLAVAYESITSRLPDDSELQLMLASLNDLRVQFQADPEMARTLVDSNASEVDLPLSDEASREGDRVEIAAYAMLVNSLFNLDISKTRQ